MTRVKSDGSTASYYELPPNSKELQDIISFKNMNGQIAEIFRACMRYGEVEHSPQLRDAKKIQFYINAEIKRLEMYGDMDAPVVDDEEEPWHDDLKKVVKDMQGGDDKIGPGSYPGPYGPMIRDDMNKKDVAEQGEDHGC